MSWLRNLAPPLIRLLLKYPIETKEKFVIISRLNTATCTGGMLCYTFLNKDKRNKIDRFRETA